MPDSPGSYKDLFLLTPNEPACAMWGSYPYQKNLSPQFAFFIFISQYRNISKT